MNIQKISWMIFAALIAAVNTGYADTVTWSETVADSKVGSSIITIRFPADHQIETHSVQVPARLLNKLAVRAVRVGNHTGQALQLKGIQLHGDQIVVIGQRLLSQWQLKSNQPSLWLQEVRVTFPRHYLANSWDVQSLQRELERLGIKIKPKPVGPKPTQQLSG